MYVFDPCTFFKYFKQLILEPKYTDLIGFFLVCLHGFSLKASNNLEIEIDFIK